MKLTCAAILFFIHTAAFAQAEIPVDYFQDPLEVPLALSGTFGELRSNHFHSGLDIKTQQREGLPVLAAADGYVSRINISHYGYGKAVYIQHPNGYTTVYGHLKELSPEIKKYVRERQYNNESYEIELFPEADDLPVDQGELVALSGNTGGSGGPHLHFEIRDGLQRPMNPLMFGIKLEDTRAPLVKGLYVYPLGEDAHANGKISRQRLELIPQGDGSYRTPQVTACGKIGFGVITVDQLNAAPNQNGVFRIEASLNGDKVFQANFEKFAFSETRHLNQLIDYEFYARNRSRIQKLFVEPSNPLSIYSGLIRDGYLHIQDSITYSYLIRVSDYEGNQRVVEIPIRGKQMIDLPEEEDNSTPYFVTANAPVHFEQNGISIDIPAGTFYQDAYLDIEFEKDKVKVHEDVIPLHSSMDITFDVSEYPEEQVDKMFVASLNKWGTSSYSGADLKGDKLSTSTRSLGTYTLDRDDTPPTVVPVNFRDGQWISNNETLKVRISDNLSGIKKFRATVNGEWILMEYEYKDNMLTHYFSDGAVTETENDFKLVVEDNVGNTTVYEATFFRKE